MSNLETKSNQVTIIAGPCSIDADNRSQIDEIASIALPSGESAIWGTRVVGIKSRTEDNPDGIGMGIDYPSLIRIRNNDMDRDEIPPSVQYAQEIVRKTGLIMATEIMDPHIQMPWYVDHIPEGKGLFWNPAVMQLGFIVGSMADIARQHGWYVGLKNGKALGATLAKANDPKTISTPMEKTWSGLATFARHMDGRVVFIQRGVEASEEEKGDYRNPPVHESARRIKENNPDAPMFFDPSHSLGPKKRKDIVRETIEAMRMQTRFGFLYNGILVESGTSKTDTLQHITIDELRDMTLEISKFREIRTRERTTHEFYFLRGGDKYGKTGTTNYNPGYYG